MVRRHLRVLLAVALAASVGLTAGCGAGRRSSPASPAAKPVVTRQVARSVAAPPASVTARCGNSVVGPALGPSPDLPSAPLVSYPKAAGGIVAFVVTPLGIFVETPTQLVISSLSGRVIRTVALPADLQATSQNTSSLVVDSAGNSYLSDYQTGAFDKLSPTGQVEWTENTGHPTGIFATGKGSAFRVSVSEVGKPGSLLFDANGHPQGASPVNLTNTTYVTQADNGDLLFSAHGRVEVLNPAGTVVLHEFGSLQSTGAGAHTGGAYQFYIQGQAAEGQDQTIYTVDETSTIEASTSTGLLEGATTLGGTLDLAGGNIYVVDNRVYVETGGIFTADVQVSSVALPTLDAYLGAPQASIDTLGWGAGLSTPADGNYFPPGSPPAVDAELAPWWSEQAAHLQLRYSIWDAGHLAVSPPPTRQVALPRTASALAHMALAIPAADTAPGPYEVEASLYNTSTDPPLLVGTTCLPYTVGAAGDRLDLSTLPPGSGAGGPVDPRGVALDSELGLNGLRGASIDWTTFLPACDASDPTRSKCGPAAMVFTQAPLSYFQAAALALKDGVTYWVQVTGGDPISLALVKRGWWQGDITALASYYSHPPGTCRNCAPVTAWEPWNEPNNTGWATGADYVASVLAPFYRGVKAANPSATVIGGSTLEVPLPWWQSLIAAGGLSFLDVAAVHPYTGNNDAFEEDGVLSDVGLLQARLGRVPLWFTEVGWWGDGDYNVVNQGNDLARAMLWQRVLHIPVWSYYYPEGASPPGGVSFTLIETSSSGDDYVKGGALATMVAADQTAGRPFQALIPTGIPHTYAAGFGPRPGGSASLVAVWSDGLATAADLRVSGPGDTPVAVTMVDEYGGTTLLSVPAGRPYPLPISGQVSYLLFPTGDRVSIQATAAYGANLALSSAGARATASSGDASDAITGSATGTGWSSSPGDHIPWLSVTLPAPATVDRIMVDTQSPGSTAQGLRDYTVSVDRPGGQWRVVGDVVNQFADHIEQIDLPAQTVSAVRITVTEINYGGYAGGGIPSFWPLDQPGVAFVHSLEVYGPPSTPAAG